MVITVYRITMKKLFLLMSFIFLICIPYAVNADGVLKENSFRYKNGISIQNEQSTNDEVTLFTLENGIKGIDVSAFQGTVDWEAVKNDGVKFAILRCGFGDDVAAYDDAQWKRNADECTRLGIPFGAYLYSYAASLEEAKSEAAHALRLLDGYDLYYPVFLDLEDDVVGVCSNELIGQIADTFCSALQEKGYMVGIYANTNWWDTKLTSEVFQDITWHKWIADWRSYCGYEGVHSMWQYTSTGSVSGITGNVDMNYSYRQFDTLGDIDGNGEIDSDDILVLTKLLSKTSVIQKWLLKIGDLNSDSTVDTTDVYLLNGIVENNGTIPDTDQDSYEYPNTYVNTGNLRNDIIGVAKTQIGYTELTSKDGTPVIDSQTPYYTKYGEAYGNPNGHWCAYFVLWCAKQAGIPTSIICQSSSCGSCKTFINWFQSNHRWEGASYTPQSGDIIFFDWETDGSADHVGIVKSVSGDIIYTIEGNTGGVNGYIVMERDRNSSVFGYGVPDYESIEKINGYANQTHTAYMLPDSNSQTVWEIWKNDELQVLCKDGDYYLVLYPFAYTGKFVAAYVPVNAVDLNKTVPSAEEYYNIFIDGIIKNDTYVYHNASTDDITGSSGNQKLRATLNEGDTVEVLFADRDFLFIKTDSITGYVSKEDVTLNSISSISGDVNGDGVADAGDAGMIVRYDTGLINLTEEQLNNADINGDGFVNAGDAGLILRKDVGLIK